jgi:uncharacterized protein YprB with RNaseH-like and TPR domain
LARDETGRVKDAFRDRLSGIGPARSPRPPATVPLRGASSAADSPRSLDELPGVTRTDGLLVIERSAAELSPDALDALLDGFRLAAGHAARADAEVRALIERPEDALFIDTETTGLAGNMVFLLGTMRIRRGDVLLTQALARDYREERALLEVWLEMARKAGMLVSFNGKAFDAPVLRDRVGLHRLEAPPEPVHVDLLHHARRRWKSVLPDCRLQTIEWRLCGRRRAGDIPGEEIPAAYHHFVRTGDAREMMTVLHHNALDLLTLADIAVALGRGDAGGARGGARLRREVG